MNESERQSVIDDLQQLIDATQRMVNRFQATGMDALMGDDYEMLLTILDSAVKQQREHTVAMLTTLTPCAADSERSSENLHSMMECEY